MATKDGKNLPTLGWPRIHHIHHHLYCFLRIPQGSEARGLGGYTELTPTFVPLYGTANRKCMSCRLVSWVKSWAVDLHQLRGNEATDDPHPRPWRSGSPNHTKIYQDTPSCILHLILSIPCLLDRPASRPTTRCQGAAHLFLFLKADWRQLLATEVLPDCGSPKISTMRPLGNPPCLRSKDGEAPWPSRYFAKKQIYNTFLNPRHSCKSKLKFPVLRKFLGCFRGWPW